MNQTIENVKNDNDVRIELENCKGLNLSDKEIEELLVDGETVRNETRETIFIYTNKKDLTLYIEKFTW